MIIPFKYDKYLRKTIDYIIKSKSDGIIVQNITSLEKYNKSLFIMYANDYVTNYSQYLPIKNGLLEELEKISEFCLKNATSIFKKENYDERVFYTCLKYVDKEKINVRKYLNKIINEENIFRVIGSFVTTSSSKICDYSYIIELDNINKYLDVNIINKILLSIDKNKKNMDQRRVMTIYNSRNNKKYKKTINFSNL